MANRVARFLIPFSGALLGILIVIFFFDGDDNLVKIASLIGAGLGVLATRILHL